MTRRERAASVTRTFRASRATSSASAVTSAPATVAPVATAGEPPQPPLPLESLFDSAPESWIALQPLATASSAAESVNVSINASATPSIMRLAAIAGGFTSRVSIEPPDAVLLEVRGSFRLFGGVQSLCAQLLERCRQGGFDLRWALAPTPLAALALARAGQPLIVLARDRLVGVLASLPLAVLRWPARTIERLESVGARTLGAVMRLPRAGFAQRFGADALLALDRLTGAAPEPRRVFITRERFRAAIEPSFELATQAMVLQHLEPLLVDLEHFLRARQSGIDLLMLRLQHRNRLATRLDVRLAAAELQAERFNELMALQMSRLVLPAPVVRCELRSGALQPWVTRSESLWSAGEHGGTTGREFPALIERLRARLGSEAVYGLCLVPEHRPENAWSVAEPVMKAMSVTQVASQLASVAQAAWLRMSRRPLWLLHEPEALPRALDQLRIVEGPERIETGWWDGRDTARDYYIARDAAGAELWIYRERMPPHGWFLHGVFG